MSSNLMDAPARTSLRTEEAVRLLAVVRNLAQEQTPEEVVDGTVQPRKAARELVIALEESPFLTLRHLIFALEEADHRATRGDTHE